ncbi:hypothetical protein VTN77DRAFT_1511 [Rasamsonia byssochlamydoides]|uniref:uncharacterized protein n=1 Tax=Rasamsonia byssochlamydoides TaxID=89139 RepID=UPI00374384C7
MPEWSKEYERLLLSTLVEVKQISVSREEWEVIAKKMDVGFSWNACRQHFAKLKKEFTPINTAASDGSTPSTPRTPRTPTKELAAGNEQTTPTKPTPRKRKSTAAANADGSAQQQEQGTPTKRSKGKKTAGPGPSGLSVELTPAVAKESSEEEEEDAKMNDIVKAEREDVDCA